MSVSVCLSLMGLGVGGELLIKECCRDFDKEGS